MKRKNRLILGSLLLAAVLTLTACGESTGENGGGQAFGEFEAELYGGGAASQEIFGEAELTMVNVWATYCGFCIEEMPYFAEFAEEYKDRGLQVYGVVTDAESAEDPAVGQIIEETGAAYPHLLFNQSMWNTCLKDVQSVPTTIFVDSKGNLVDAYIGAKSQAQWKEIIEELL